RRHTRSDRDWSSDVCSSDLALGTGDLVVDLGRAELIDATGLGVLVGTHRRADRAGRRLVLRAVPDRIDRLLIATRLHRVLAVEQIGRASCRERGWGAVGGGW